jgi:hypothetical protein
MDGDGPVHAGTLDVEPDLHGGVFSWSNTRITTNRMIAVGRSTDGHVVVGEVVKHVADLASGVAARVAWEEVEVCENE